MTTFEPYDPARHNAPRRPNHPEASALIGEGLGGNPQKLYAFAVREVLDELSGAQGQAWHAPTRHKCEERYCPDGDATPQEFERFFAWVREESAAVMAIEARNSSRVHHLLTTRASALRLSASNPDWERAASVIEQYLRSRWGLKGELPTCRAGIDRLAGRVAFESMPAGFRQMRKEPRREVASAEVQT